MNNIIISYIKQGFGNKIFMLGQILYIWKQIYKSNPSYNKILIFYKISRHEQKENEKHKLNYIFRKIIHPITKEDNFIEIISWEQYDKLLIKKEHDIVSENKDYNFQNISGIINITTNYDFHNLTMTNVAPLMKKIFIFNPIYENNLKDFDTNNGIAVHIRYGDKILINIKNKKMIYTILRPAFYINAIINITKKNTNIPIYLFTDSTKIVELCILPKLIELGYNPIIPNLDFPEVFYLFTKFKHLIISDSTIAVGALWLSDIKYQAIAYKWYPNPNPNHKLLSDVKYKNFELREVSHYPIANITLIDNYEYLWTKVVYPKTTKEKKLSKKIINLL
jgi:hypothetical protein